MAKKLSTDAVIILSIVLFAAAMFVMKMRSIGNAKAYHEQTLICEYESGGVACMLSMTEGQLTYAVLVTAEDFRLTDSSGKWREKDDAPADYTGYVRFQAEGDQLKHFVPIKRRGEISIVAVDGAITTAPDAFVLPNGATKLEDGHFDLERYPQFKEIAATFAHSQQPSKPASVN
ncbi:hypothetical protein [Cerasicoccus maritimus]|uniref:hypothetical protein n=1 Tax=Cerasicoccus maritimus TaxID=490089 RepID=UPI002852B379|nr:hypothetical protein [Cerasicoccus maritimus]